MRRLSWAVLLVCLYLSSVQAIVDPPLVDDCNRTANPLASGWAGPYDPDNLGNWTANGTVCVSETAAASSYWSTLMGADMVITATVPDAVTTGTNMIELGVRLQQPSTTLQTVDLYFCRWQPSSGLALIRRVVNGATSVQLTSVSSALASGDSIGCQVIGNEISLWQKPAAGSWTLVSSVVDTTITGAGYAAIGTNTNTMTLDNIRLSPVISTRLGLHHTAEEVALWQQRSATDAEYTVILANADAWVASPEARWAGQTAASCWDDSISPPGRTRDSGLTDAAFVYLLTGDSSYRDPVLAALLAQTSVVGTNFADATRWCITHDGTQGIGDDIGPWIKRLIYGYSYIRSSVSASQQSVIETWLSNIATWISVATHNNVKKRFANRLLDDYSCTGSVGSWCPGGSVGLTHFGGSTVYSFHASWSNQSLSSMSVVGAVGALMNDATHIASAKRLVKEWLTYGVFPGGIPMDQYRWAGNTPQHGYLYPMAVTGSVISIADHLARIGDFELYTYSTTDGLHGTAGTPAKTLLSVLQHEAGLTNGTELNYTVASFNDAVFDIPSQTYGPANEACESPGVGDIELSTTDAWEAAIENTANAGKRFFLNAGTYTLTSGNILIVVPGTSTSVTTVIKPNNCAAVTIHSNDAARTQLCSYTTIAGMTFTRNFTSSGAAMLDFTTGLTCAGSIIRNNVIAADGGPQIKIRSVLNTNLLIEGNIFRYEGEDGEEQSDINISGPQVNMRIQRNKFDKSATDVGGGNASIHLLGVVSGNNWGGDVTIWQNYFAGQSGSFYVDGKVPGTGLTGIINVEENYFDGLGQNVNQSCVLLHGQWDLPPYTTNIRRNVFVQCYRAIDHFIAAGEVGPYDGATANIEHNIFIPRTPAAQPDLWIQRNLATIKGNAFVGAAGRIRIGNTENPNPSNIVFSNNIAYQTTFTDGAGIDVCEHNIFFGTTGAPTCTNTLTSDPLFVNPASDWHLQAASPAIGSGLAGVDRGPYQPTFLIDQTGPVQVQVDFVNLAPANVYYRDAAVKTAYTKTIPGSFATSGCDMLRGEWCNYPRIRFMFGSMEGLHWPYGSSASILYVDNTNTCDGTGTSVDPYCSLQVGLDHLTPGATLRIRTGSGVYDQYATTTARHGTVNTPIMIEPDTGAVFVLRNCDPGAAEAALEILDSDYWTIQGLTFDGIGCGTAPSRRALNLQGLTRDITGIQVLNNTFKDWRQTTGAADGAEALRLAGCDTAIGCGANFHAIGATVQGNHFSNIDLTAMRLIRTQGALVAENTISAMRCGRQGSGGPAETIGIHYTHSNTTLTLQHNTIENFTSYLSCPLTSQGVATVAGIWCDTGGGMDSDNVIERNTIHGLDDGKADLANAAGTSHSAAGIFLEEQCAGTLVKNNVLYDIGTYGMRNEYHATGGTSDTANAYYHNSLYDMLEPLYFKEGVAIVKNNLVSICRGVCINNDDDANNTLTIDGNLYHDGGTQTKIGQISPGSPLVFTAWQSACSCDATSKNADPQLAVVP